MKQASEEKILSATKPSDIFSMNADLIEQEKEKYLERFKPKAYSTIRNFVLMQKVTLLYRQAICEIRNVDIRASTDFVLTIDDLHFIYNYSCDIRLGQMYVTEDHIIYVINSKYSRYYNNYVDKVRALPKLDSNIWKITQHMVPHLSKNFIDSNGNLIIMIDKPYKFMYPLREILNYFNQSLKAEYVASILTRLYYFECYMDLIGMTHNGITIDNLFFAPGKFVEEDQDYTIDDLRIVGVFGGWFFSTWSDEKLVGMPKEIYDLLPTVCKQNGYSSFEVDMLSIQKLGIDLLGDANLENLPLPFKSWLTKTHIGKNSYEEFQGWEDVITQSFGKHKFTEMNINI